MLFQWFLVTLQLSVGIHSVATVVVRDWHAVALKSATQMSNKRLSCATTPKQVPFRQNMLIFEPFVVSVFHVLTDINNIYSINIIFNHKSCLIKR